ncbi:PKD domain-containing protein [Marivirga sp.]|uniref:PKD domain-containing protein n=1 Tax=Marivirga sp. TaxID=2018662 RepID=UPI003DA715A1
MKKAIYQLGLWSMILALVFACDEDPVETDPPTASFQFEVGETDFLTVTFTNFSQNYESSEWDFGDGSEGSTEENPVHTYEAAGEYTVTLTVTNAAGESATREEVVEVDDPLAAQRALIGDDGKTWQLLAEPSGIDYPIWVGPNTDDGSVVVWFALGNQQPICERECIFDDTWTFNVDGTYTFENNGDFWAEGGVWSEPGCFDTSAPDAFVGADGQDLSGWDSGTHPFTYNAQNNSLTIEGGFIGLTKAATSAEVTEPQESVTYEVVKLVEADVDTLVLKTQLEEAGGFWQFTLVSYGDTNPVTVEDCPDDGGGDKTIIENVAFDFEADAPTFNPFGGTDDQGGGMVYEVIDNPDASGINTSATVASLFEPEASKFYSGASTQLDGYVSFASKNTFKMKVWSPIEGAVVKLKLEDSANPNTAAEVDQTIETANEWVELTYEFSAEDSEKFDVLVVFFDFDPAGDGSTVKSTERTHYFDDIILE